MMEAQSISRQCLAINRVDRSALTECLAATERAIRASEALILRPDQCNAGLEEVLLTRSKPCTAKINLCARSQHLGNIEATTVSTQPDGSRARFCRLAKKGHSKSTLQQRCSAVCCSSASRACSDFRRASFASRLSCSYSSLVDVPIFRRSSPTVRENSAVAASYSDANRIFSSHPILPPRNQYLSFGRLDAHLPTQSKARRGGFAR